MLGLTDDLMVPMEQARRIATARRARLMVTQGLGHNRVLADPAVVQEVAAFLNTANSSAR